MGCGFLMDIGHRPFKPKHAGIYRVKQGRKLQIKLKTQKGTKSESNTGLEVRSHSPQGPDNKYLYLDKHGKEEK